MLCFRSVGLRVEDEGPTRPFFVVCVLLRNELVCFASLPVRLLVADPALFGHNVCLVCVDIDIVLHVLPNMHA